MNKDEAVVPGLRCIVQEEGLVCFIVGFNQIENISPNGLQHLLNFGKWNGGWACIRTNAERCWRLKNTKNHWHPWNENKHTWVQYFSTPIAEPMIFDSSRVLVYTAAAPELFQQLYA